MTKKQIYLTIIFGVIFSLGMYDFLSNLKLPEEQTALHDIPRKLQQKKEQEDKQEITQLIDELTDENLIIDYVKKHHRLPGYYLTKADARDLGWEASKGNLCEVLPGKAIGGDIFKNREKKLPEGKKYYEADVNYKCGRRNADRIIFTKQGEVWLTKDHYKTFIKQ